jgi:hypothetical protein
MGKVDESWKTIVDQELFKYLQHLKAYRLIAMVPKENNGSVNIMEEYKCPLYDPSPMRYDEMYALE